MDFFSIRLAARRKARWFRLFSIPFLALGAPTMCLGVAVALCFVTLFAHLALESWLGIRLHSELGGFAPLFPVFPLLGFLPINQEQISDSLRWTWAAIDIAVTAVLLAALSRRLKNDRSRDLNGAFAGALDASELTREDADAEERQLLNVVEEMSVAALLPPPRVYTWRAGVGVNALAWRDGSRLGEIYVSSGALALLDRDETQALVAHEMSRALLAAEIPKLRTLGAVIMNLGAFRLANWLVRPPTRFELPDEGSLPFRIWQLILTSFLRVVFYLAYLPFAVVLWVGGALQHVIGSIFMALMTRWEIRNADLLALQYTRNPSAIKTLLMKALVHGGSLRGDADDRGGDDVVFAPLSRSRWFDVRPSIEARLKAIDAQYRPADLAAFREIEASRLRKMQLELHETGAPAGREHQRWSVLSSTGR